MEQKYFDLVIVGAGCVGVAAAYYALQEKWLDDQVDLNGKPENKDKNKEERKEEKWSICLIEQQKIGSPDRYWSSSFSARQNRVQYNEEYLTKYVVKSNKEWHSVEQNFKNKDGTGPTFLHKEGALWFGNKNVSTSQGNIKASNAVINQINSSGQERIESLYMEKLMQGEPSFMKAFKPKDPTGTQSTTSEWDNWSALYQPDGGSVDMQTSYNSFLDFIRSHGVKIYDGTNIDSHLFDQNNKTHYFNATTSDNKTVKISGKKMLITAGVYTPFFLKSIMNQPYLVDNNQYDLQEYVASYIKIDDKSDSRKGYQIYKNLPNFINFLDKSQNIESKQKSDSGYGFRYHEWDNMGQTKSLFVKIGTMAYQTLTQDQLKKAKYTPILRQNDHRIEDTKSYVRNRMNYLLPDHEENRHFPCPIIFYKGRETLCDYLNRTDESIVVQSGGWIGKYYPLLARTCILMLRHPKLIQQKRSQDKSVYGSFLNRTRFPITHRITSLLDKLPARGDANAYNNQIHFKTAIIGAGCSGLYAAYRLNEQKHAKPIVDKDGKVILDEKTIQQRKKNIGNIGVFELSQRISGRLKSFKFNGTSTPMELGGMRYIPTNHVLVNKIITDLGIPHLKFSMNGDPIQHAARTAFLRNDYYRMNQWQTTQKAKNCLHTAYRMDGHAVGMDSFQIVAFSFYMILTAPENIHLLDEVFLTKTDADIQQEKLHLKMLGEKEIHYQSSYYRTWRNYVYVDPENNKNYFAKLSLKQWNYLKPILLFRFRYPIQARDVYCDQKPVQIDKTYPLYKFGFQNVIQAQFGHEVYQFFADQNGYFSISSNASYLDQVNSYMLDFGDVKYRTLASGFDQINYAMANVLMDKHRGLNTNQNEGIYLGHKLVNILPGRNGAKYQLVFHVAVQPSTITHHHKTRINHCKQYKKEKKQEPKLGKFQKFEDSGYGEVRFTCDRLILAMPKKSVTNLTNHITLLQRPIEQTYNKIYEQVKKTYYNTLQYHQLNQYVNKKKEKGYQPLTKDEEDRLKFLREKQAKKWQDDNVDMKQSQFDQLELLSLRELIHKLKPLNQKQLKFESQKVSKFDKDKPILPNDLSKLADSTNAMPAMKIVMNFDRSWWDPNLALNQKYQQTYKNTNLINSVEQMRGVSVTDLPIRQTLYFSSGQDNLLLASYNDMTTTEFWSALHDNFTEVWQPCNTQECRMRMTYPSNLDIHPAKTVLVQEIIKQLSLMHQIDVDEKWVKECVYQFWGKDLYGAGYHTFAAGYHIPAVMKTIRKPWADQNIHIVGEAYSNEPGWVEGAFQTTELLLQQELKLPEFVPNYYAGY